MPINPSIAMGYRAPRIQQPDPEAEMSRGLQLKSLLMQQRAADEARADDQAQRDAFRASGGDEAAYLKNLMQGGNVRGYQSAVEFYDKRKKAEADRLKAAADLKKTGADTEKVGAETAGILSRNDAERLTQHNNLLAGVASVDDGRAWVQLGLQSGAIKPDNAPFILQTFERAQTPEQLRDVVNRLSLGMKDYIEKNAPKYQTRNTGGSTDTISMPGLGGPVSVVNSVTNTQSPDNAASNARMAADAAAGREQSERHFKANKDLQRERLEFERNMAVADSGGPGQVELTKKFGKAPKDHRWKADGSAEPIPGGPADLKAGELGAKAAAKRDAQISQAESVLGTIRDAKKLVGYTTAGAGGYLSGVAATPARDLQGKLETVKANLGFDRLQQMRDNSPTGGALGAVAVQELTALQSTVASLDQLQSPTQLRNALDKIDRHYTRWLDVMKQAGGGKGGADASFDEKPKTIKRTGTQNGRRVIEYSDGSIEYAN